MTNKVFVGLSGGVDSGVSAALLQERGFDVTGVFIKIWQPEFYECTWREDRLDAMRICAALDIPLREIDLSAQYKKEVVDPMMQDYARGITPNPDIVCNRRIKFGVFASWAKKEGVPLIATGHYAQIRQEGGHYELLRAKDSAKDQSYFLYLLEQADLAHVMFPIGDMLKADVRKCAMRFDLPVAEKSDSQGLCFVGEVSMREYLSRFIPVVSGPVVNREGKCIGEHEGALMYTLGQRHGFSSGHTAGGPFFVTCIDVARNTVRVSADREDAACKSVLVDDMHWIHRTPDLPYEGQVQARYHEKPVHARISKEGAHTLITFSEPHIASPGQSVVVYQGDVCLGGGSISLKLPAKA